MILDWHFTNTKKCIRNIHQVARSRQHILVTLGDVKTYFRQTAMTSYEIDAVF